MATRLFLSCRPCGPGWNTQARRHHPLSLAPAATERRSLRRATDAFPSRRTFLAAGRGVLFAARRERRRGPVGAGARAPGGGTSPGCGATHHASAPPRARLCDDHRRGPHQARLVDEEHLRLRVSREPRLPCSLVPDGAAAAGEWLGSSITPWHGHNYFPTSHIPELAPGSPRVAVPHVERGVRV